MMRGKRKVLFKKVYILFIVLGIFIAQGCATYKEYEIDYDNIFRETCSNQDISVRYACLQELIRSQDDSFYLMKDYLENGTKKEQETAALVLLKIASPDSLRVVAPYYVAKLKDATYVFHGLDRGTYYVGGSWEVNTGTDDETTEYFPMRNAVGVVYELGQYAIPSLVELLRDKDFVTRLNAHGMLERITNSTLPSIKYDKRKR